MKLIRLKTIRLTVDETEQVVKAINARIVRHKQPGCENVVNVLKVVLGFIEEAPIEEYNG